MKSIYRFWVILIQPADSDMILYFPIRQEKPLRGNLTFDGIQNAYLISPFLVSYASP
jgi:hypothetical protein